MLGTPIGAVVAVVSTAALVLTPVELRAERDFCRHAPELEPGVEKTGRDFCLSLGLGLQGSGSGHPRTRRVAAFVFGASLFADGVLDEIGDFALEHGHPRVARRTTARTRR